MNKKQQSKIYFIMLVAKALHRYGASADRIESALKLVAEKFEIKADFFSLPTGFFASFTSDEISQHTRFSRFEPGRINLEKLYLVDKTVDLVLSEDLTVEHGTQFIQDILKQAPRYNNFVVTLGLTMIAATVSLFLNGSWYDSFCAAFFGMIVGFSSESVRKEKIDSIFDGVIAFVVTTGTYIFHYLGFDISPANVILASLIYLIPGLTLTTAIAELASQNITSGTSRLMGAIIVLLKISFGIFIANTIAQLFSISIVAHDPVFVSGITKGIALFLTSIGLIFAFQARIEDGIWIVIMCYASFYSSHIFLALLGATASSFFAGTVVGALSNFFARVLNRPALIFLLPAILLLVPGSIGYKSLNFMFSDNPIEGIKSAFDTFSIALALVSGVYFGNILIRPKRYL